jgi:hypothetical protein
VPEEKKETLSEILDRISSQGKPKSIKTLPPDHEVMIADAKQLTRLKKIYGFGLLTMMAIQLVVVNALFGVYAWLGFHWAPPEGVVQIWLTATFVQIVSVVYVITRSLFPPEKS